MRVAAPLLAFPTAYPGFRNPHRTKGMSNRQYRPIDDHGIIGDCRSAALVSRDGTIDWLCWPRFDSPSIFAALLDLDIGGHWSLHPTNVLSSSRHYIERTNVLESTFLCTTGECVHTDCMCLSANRHEATPGLADHEILRKVECTRGEIDLVCDFQPRPGYATSDIRLRSRGKLGIELELFRSEAWFRSTHPCTVMDTGVQSRVHLRAGDVAWFSFSFSAECPAVLPSLGEEAEQRLQCTIARWRHWTESFCYDGPHKEIVLRSALALKLMAYAPSGAIIAAPTTSLPERIGGSLNWDYRYCWLRDASLTVRALNGLGFRNEVDAFIGWLLNATALTLPELQVLYTVFGNKPRREYEAPQFAGYLESRPVRIHNAAVDQLQLDLYGEVLDAVAQYVYTGGKLEASSQLAIRGMADYVCKNWDQPDDGIWEPRGQRQNHTHSRLLCWVALDRVVNMAKRGALKGINESAVTRTRDKIRDQILDRAWNPKLQSYTATYEGRAMDASLLLMSWYGFEHADSPRMKSTYERIVEELRASDSLIYRYRLTAPEGAFGICCFWEAEFLALGGGTEEEASAHFEHLLEYANDLGLFAEEIDPRSGAALGNFPQAFTHVGLISAAISLAERLRGQKQLEHRHSTAA
jgi:GH15 family glucan-1,4-alpha-glucosidase